jgi:transcriptional regulator with XRE-family HTH domain
VTDLSGLILKAQHEQGLSYPDLLKRAHDAGYVFLTKAALSKLVHKPMRAFPFPETLFALAAALDVPPSVIVAAVAESFGITIHEPVAPGAPTRFTRTATSPRRVERVRGVNEPPATR